MLRLPALVACATGAAVAGALPILWARPGELADRVAVALVIAAYAATALVILLARPGNRVARLMLLGTGAWALGEMLLGWGVQGWARTDPVAAGAAHAAVAGTALRGAGWLVLILGVPLIFPDGDTAWPGRRTPRVLLVLSVAAFALGCIVAPYPLEARLADLRSPTGIPLSAKVLADLLAVSALALAFLTLVVAIIGLRVKWRRADALGRQQLLWFAAGFALPLLCLPLAVTPWASPWLFAAVSAPIPIALGVALLQRRLYDIELVMSRSLTYLLVFASAVAIYAGTIAAVGILLRRPGAQWLPWVGAAVVALVFTPLRVGVSSLANRVTYGHWSAPADVLAATERRLRDATDLPGLLQAMVTELADLLRLPHLELLDTHGDVVCSAGQVTARPTEELGLTAYGAPIGTMRWASTPLGSNDRRLLDDVARQLGEALHAAALVEALRHAQERLVVSREEERKRLRRDLHDGLGPSLAALGMEVDGLRNRMPALRPEQTDTELLALREGIQRTVLEVRRVVEGLRPPALDELGLDGAVHQLARRLATPARPTAAPGRPLTIDATVQLNGLPELPAATEVAAFRITQEALTNAIRHANASHVLASITVEDDELVVRVRDDGHGLAGSRDEGVGLSAMRERAEELGGSFDIRADATIGTTIEARIPLHAAAFPLNTRIRT
jgi:two-component system, NarL family, sensor kinase